MAKLITIDKMKEIIERLTRSFVTRNEIDGVYNYTSVIVEDQLLSLSLKGPDNKTYRLALNDDFRLVLIEHVESRQVDYLKSGNQYYKIEENSNGSMSLVLTSSVPSGATTGTLKAVDEVTGTKYAISVADGTVTFTESSGTTADEAKYLKCANNQQRACYFKIHDNQVYWESCIIETSPLTIKN